MLGDKDKQILYLYFWKEMPQSEIAKQLNIPIGTVKSRLHTAKQNFKNKYPYRTDVSKGERSMKKLPEFIPEYKIEASTEAPFAVKWEELMGWFLVPNGIFVMLFHRTLCFCSLVPHKPSGGI